MQERHKQLASHNQINLYNKLNYHLKKVEPYRNKTKRTVAEQMKLYNRNQKVSTVNNNRKYIRKQNYQYEYEQPEHINQEHLNKNIQMAASQVKIYQKPNSARKNVLERGNSQSKLRKIDVAQRGKSLKYWRVQRPQPKFLTQIRGFFNTFLTQNDGCKCGPNCQCKQVLLKWINVPDDLIYKNYSRMLSMAYQKTYRSETRSSNISQQFYQQQFSKQEKKQMLKHQMQIKKDVIRTQTQCQLFHQKQIQDKLERILMCYTVEDPEVAYVQSMNIVASGVLYHVRDQAITFAICRKLFHQIRKIYLHDFKECYRHVDKIISLIQQHVVDLHRHLQQTGVDLRVILFPWVLSLLCVVVPLDHLHLVYIGFVKQSWKFIYRTILSLFVYHKDKIKDMYESGDILVFLSASNEQEKESIDWQDIVRYGQHLCNYV